MQSSANGIQAKADLGIQTTFFTTKHLMFFTIMRLDLQRG